MALTISVIMLHNVLFNYSMLSWWTTWIIISLYATGLGEPYGRQCI